MQMMMVWSRGGNVGSVCKRRLGHDAWEETGIGDYIQRFRGRERERGKFTMTRMTTLTSELE
jgi:hypothetical protein